MKTDQEIIREWSQEHAHNDESQFVERLRRRGLMDCDIVEVLHAIEYVSKHCWDSKNGCYCSYAW